MKARKRTLKMRKRDWSKLYTLLAWTEQLHELNIIKKQLSKPILRIVK